MAQNLSGNDLQGWDGWIWIGGGSRVSATSLTITGDYTAIISPGDRLKLTDTTTKYFYVLTPVTFSAGVTTLTITGGSDYSLVGTPSAISYSKMATPVGFPQWFNYSPTYTGFSANPTGTVRFNVQGRTVFYNVYLTTGTSNAAGTTWTVSLPITAGSSFNSEGFIRSVDNGAATTTGGIWTIAASGTTASIFKDASGGTAWTATGTKNARGIIVYEF